MLSFELMGMTNGCACLGYLYLHMYGGAFNQDRHQKYDVALVINTKQIIADNCTSIGSVVCWTSISPGADGDSAVSPMNAMIAAWKGKRQKANGQQR